MELCPGAAVISMILLLTFCFQPTSSFVIEGSSTPDFDGVAVNCGSVGSFTALDGRDWIGDVGLDLGALQPPKGESVSSVSLGRSVSLVDAVPYMTARASFSEFYYIFEVSPGQKFIRFHFMPAASYSGFGGFKDLFTVKAGPFTLLEKFSPSLAIDSLEVKVIVKEFCLNLKEEKFLNISFIPVKTARSGKSFAFINGIEIVSMPAGLYFTPDGHLGIPVVGKKFRFHIDNSTALELIQRLNIGGMSIPAVEDSGLFRTWSADSDYLLESDVLPLNYETRSVRHIGIPSYIAPVKVHQTFWSTAPRDFGGKLPRLRWKMSLETGFEYLLRLHFCELDPSITDNDERQFTISINGDIVENAADVIYWSGSNGIPVLKDYILTVGAEKRMSRSDMVITLQSKIHKRNSLLNGLEVFKLSSYQGRLASPMSASLTKPAAFWSLRLTGVPALIAAAEIILFLLNVIAFWSFRKRKENSADQRNSSSNPFLPLCRIFSLSEIHSATENFSESFVIGRGGFGKVYKGLIFNGTEKVAIKRLSSNSKQGEHEFWTEIEILSKLRHTNLVTLLGYCNESQEMILVYEYMSKHTLSHHLYKIDGHADEFSPISWEKRLQICIGAARGIDCLHAGSKRGVIHRDVKSLNILLDENFVAKLSDFGLAKLENPSQLKSYMSTKVKGTRGYLDPQYYSTHRLTRKTDVYAFGVVLLEVLCGRRAIDRSLVENEWSLKSWAQGYIREGKADQIMAESLKGEIVPNSLKEFVSIVEKCLHDQPKERPTMAQVVVWLESALEQQQIATLTTPLMYSAEGDSTYQEMTPAHGGCFGTPMAQTSAFSSQERIKGNFADNNLSQPQRTWIYGLFRKRKSEITREKFFQQHTGLLLQPNLRAFNVFTETVYIFSGEELKKATNDYHQSRFIGHGGNGKFYKGILPNNRVIAVKKREIVDNPYGSTRIIEESVYEAVISSKINHRNIVKMLGCCLDTEIPLLVYEFIDSGTLCHCLHDPNATFILTWEMRLRIATETAEALAYLHFEAPVPIIHRHIKSWNILLDNTLTAKVTAFPFTRKIPGDQTHLTTDEWRRMGYLDPEYMTSRHLTQKSDVYSFGVVLAELLTGRKPTSSYLPKKEEFLASSFCASNQEHFLRQILDKKLALAEGGAWKQILQVAGLAVRCLRNNASDRPTMKEVASELERLRLMETNMQIQCEIDSLVFDDGLSSNSGTIV